MRGICRCAIFLLAFVGALSSGSDAFPRGSAVNYAEVRKRVTRSYPEKANEIADTISVLQDLSKATVAMVQEISAHCPQ